MVGGWYSRRALRQTHRDACAAQRGQGLQQLGMLGTHGKLLFLDPSWEGRSGSQGQLPHFVHFQGNFAAFFGVYKHGQAVGPGLGPESGMCRRPEDVFRN